ncbi:GGDEF domain-containing protein [Sphingomonas lycopersici]|uniref:diguanylate cyclase n=1 Tax=Sphingomonas lycopersici TaxID=2951807 RepID=A0AA42CP55_9SPHN|nr:GGDEF domain-containing protein [Sphingomonas lycopersici]MCW6533989.1 GGDEF domain-containing protein [Sphingomonas lycopersici]
MMAVAKLLGGVPCRLAFALLAMCWGVPAMAEAIGLRSSLCHAVTDSQAHDDRLASLRFSCTDAPRDYQRGSLWLTSRLDRLPIEPRHIVLMVHYSRFDRLAVAFSYADGAVRWQEVSGGRFGTHWRAGGQIAFEAPDRDASITAVTLRFERLADYGLLHARLMPAAEGVEQSTVLAAIIGAALTLLLVGGIYTLSLAAAIRRHFLAWHGAWAVCMFVWGAIWSQLDLLAFPMMAGTVSAQICTFLSCLAVALATASAVTSLGRDTLPRVLRTATLALGAANAVAGIPLALIRGPGLTQFAELLGYLILADLAAVTLCLGWAWRRGSTEARDFAGAWSVPMATLAAIQLVDMDDHLWGAGSKLVILLAATWQTLWLTIATTRRIGRLRIERDRARAGEALAREAARRDALTGVRNRRGFEENVASLLDRARAGGLPAALLLIDIDRFKSINDEHGHDAGDAVLHRIGERIAAWEGAMCTVGRIGGEEFGLLAVGLDGLILDRFAESVRVGIAACDHRRIIGDQIVTASIGVAQSRVAADFRELFKLADEALYEAKHAGRNRVVSRRYRGHAARSADPPVAARDQAAFRSSR